jgi:hypothetical protein
VKRFGLGQGCLQRGTAGTDSAISLVLLMLAPLNRVIEITPAAENGSERE